MSGFAIRTKDLLKNYGYTSAVDNLSIEIPTNGLIGLIGRNGSGKTTFMKLCGGLLDKTSGTLEVLGADPMDNLEVLSNFVYTYHDMDYEGKPRLKNIMENYEVMFKKFDYDFALKLIRYFNLGPNYKYKNLSKGMASIFNFICGLSCRADITMFDEPVLGMDVTVRKSAYEILLRDYIEYPRTIIISSHLLAELESILSDILIIDRGKLVLFQNTDELRQSAYMVEGNKNQLEEFIKNRNVIYRKSGINQTAVVREKYDDSVIAKAAEHQLNISAVRPEDLYVYITRENKEGELECLWEKAN